MCPSVYYIRTVVIVQARRLRLHRHKPESAYPSKRTFTSWKSKDCKLKIKKGMNFKPNIISFKRMLLDDDERSILHAYYSNSYLRQAKDKCENLMKFIKRGWVIQMQKSWFGSRRHTKVRQRAKARLKNTHKNGIWEIFLENSYKKQLKQCLFSLLKLFFYFISCVFVLR